MAATPNRFTSKLSRGCSIAGVVGATTLVVWCAVLVCKWPFTEAKITVALEKFSRSEVHFGAFRMVYWPEPGYEAERVAFTRKRGTDTVTVGSIAHVRALSSWITVMTARRHLKTVNLEGLHVRVDEPTLPPVDFHNRTRDQTTIGLLQANGAVLDFVRPEENSGKTVSFAFERLVLHNLGRDKRIDVDFLAHVPMGAGRLAVQGTFGPVGKDLQGIPFAGKWALRDADLASVWPVVGLLAAKGRVQGSAARCLVIGEGDVPAFALKSVGHALPVWTRFGATVDAVHGTLALHVESAKLGGSTLEADGNINKASPDGPRLLTLDSQEQAGRVEDLLWLFSHRDRPAVHGPIRLRAHIILPFAPGPFLKRLSLQGNFLVNHARFATTHTRFALDDLSRRGQGQKKSGSDVQPEFDAAVTLRNAVAYLHPVRFSMPGASGSGIGTYNLRGGAVSIVGQLRLAVSLSRAAGGIRSVLLRPLDPFFDRNGGGAVLPIRVSGTYSHPEFQLNWKK